MIVDACEAKMWNEYFSRGATESIHRPRILFGGSAKAD
jgi:hypothetical protein